jgi:hypothetical protein
VPDDYCNAADTFGADAFEQRGNYIDNASSIASE